MVPPFKNGEYSMSKNFLSTLVSATLTVLYFAAAVAAVSATIGG
jgi:hypothetical protein